MQNLAGQQIDKYRLIRFLGKGGFSEVYLAEHISLQKSVAIKVLKRQTTYVERQKFLSEARLTAKLDHPHIVKVFDCGIASGQIPYLVMDYTPAGTLRQQLQTKGVSATMLVQYIKQLAEALDYIHSRNLIHQDVKPENILLGSNQQVLLSDFGIAITQQHVGTQHGVGTASYMAPERIQNSPSPASDQYSLGIIVYECLCGTCPFTGSSQEILDKHLHMPVPALPPSAKAPHEVECVVQRSLAKEPGQRYKSVKDFALAFEHAWENTLDKSAGTTIAESNPSPQTPSDTIPVISPGQFVAMPLTATSDTIPVPSLRVAYRTATEFIYRGHCDFVRAVSWSPDGKRIASGGDDLEIHLWDATSGNNPSIYWGHASGIRSMQWSPDPNTTYIASGSTDLEIHVWNASTKALHCSYQGHVGQARSLSLTCTLAWSHNGKRIASGGADHSVQVWEALSGKTYWTSQEHTDDVNALGWAYGGHHVVSASSDHTVRVWDATRGTSLLTYCQHNKPVHALAWSPDGNRLASGDNSANIHIWNVALGNQTTIVIKGHMQSVNALAWSPDGRLLASGSSDTTTQVWDASTGKHLFTCHGHEGAVYSLAWSPDGNYLASASADKTVRIWHVVNL